LEEFLYRKVGKPGKVRQTEKYQWDINFTILFRLANNTVRLDSGHVIANGLPGQ
jgi:hypothetical protein